MFGPCPKCGDTAPSIAATAWINIVDADSPSAARMEITDIQTDEVQLHCANCSHALPLREQSAADLVISLFVSLFEAHGLDPARIGELILSEEVSS
ncbi:hypothetical protein [Streptomyces sp. NRRL S-350]|uniref:hypothetical protein n=1 Tax=Streptomyces sp. NRRL S-350 TaxID=1463902 RepID=UPI0004C22ED0|nr:hypothetical protein [Streptomyces sp. NRRL S-350]